MLKFLAYSLLMQKLPILKLPPWLSTIELLLKSVNPSAAKETLNPIALRTVTYYKDLKCKKMVCAGAICLKVFLAQYSKNIYG